MDIGIDGLRHVETEAYLACFIENEYYSHQNCAKR